MENRKTPEEFWKEYEETTGEKVLARGLGQYVSGWQEFDGYRGKPPWGLVIATSGGFRFFHFPQGSGLLGALIPGRNTSSEKTIFIPSDKIVSAALQKETRWYKKLFSHDSPFLRLRYLGESSGNEKELLFSAVHQPGENKSDIAMALMKNRSQHQIETTPPPRMVGDTHITPP